LLANPLDFFGNWSVTVLRRRGWQLGKPVFNDAVSVCVAEIHKRSEAAQIAKAAEACAHAGSIAEAVAISMDIEQLIYEASRLHDAASLMNRLSQE
jgi:hypothetical protein